MKVVKTSSLLIFGLSLLLFSCVSKEKHETEIAAFTKAAEESEKQIIELESKVEQLKSELENIPKETKISGTYFKVQIGAYDNLDLSNYANHENFGLEKDNDGTLKYTLGEFKSYDDATSFKKLMHDIGVKGAWIVSYKIILKT